MEYFLPQYIFFENKQFFFGRAQANGSAQARDQRLNPCQQPFTEKTNSAVPFCICTYFNKPLLYITNFFKLNCRTLESLLEIRMHILRTCVMLRSAQRRGQSRERLAGYLDDATPLRRIEPHSRRPIVHRNSVC